MPQRPSSLIYQDARTARENSQSFDGDGLFTSPDLVPITWLFAFGGRNIWNPGDSVEERGGAVGERNPYETDVEVAVLRLEYAESALSTSAPYLWPWLASISILRRKLLTKPRTGFIRVAAPWLVSLKDKDFEQWRAATAFVENCVHYISSGQHGHSLESLRQIKPFCPFVPEGNPTDLKKFRALKQYANEGEPMRVALLTVGEPENRGPFEVAVHRDIAMALEEYEVLAAKPFVPPAPIIVAASKSAAPTSNPEPAARATSVFGKLTGMFKKK